MIKDIMGLFRGKNEQQVEEYQDHTQPSITAAPIAIICSGCGANNLISSNSLCEYCGSPLSYKTAPSEVTDKASVNQDLDLTNKDNVYILTTGYYTAGIDIPIGTCNVTAISGNGNLISSDYGVNEMFGTERGYVSSFKGLILPSDVKLTISGKLKIKLAYKAVDNGFSGRTYDMSGAIDISAGNYIAGKDFKSGFYKIKAVSGIGNISTDDYEVNETLGFDDDLVNEINNVDLSKGAVLSLEGDLSAKLIPEVTK